MRDCITHEYWLSIGALYHWPGSEILEDKGAHFGLNVGHLGYYLSAKCVQL